MRLEKLLQDKPLYYAKIDYARFPNIYNRIKNSFKPPKIVHIVGTNAKGSTGRALAHILYKKGLSVGHYSSPHIVKFNERIWVDGEDVDDGVLEDAHQKLQTILSKEQSNTLSYFEYTTLLAMLIFCERCEYVVLEAGVGGEFDATNVFEKKLSIVTLVGFDHQALLGSTIQKIATTKIRSVSKDLLLAKQHEEEVYKIASKRVEEVGGRLYLAQSYLKSSFYHDLEVWAKEKTYPSFFIDNFSTAFCAAKLLGYEAQIDILDSLNLFGRCQKIAPNITIDVGHNPLAATALKEHFSDKKVILIYNSYDDKEYSVVLQILKPVIKEVQIINIESDREVSRANLKSVLEEQDIKYSIFNKTQKEEEYLVFGSFSVVQRFMSLSL